MRIALAERFQRDAGGLSPDERAALFEALLALSGVLGQPHLHHGLGLRKLHPSGVWEARIGLGLRILFTLDAGTHTLVRAGTHEDVRGFLRSL